MRCRRCHTACVKVTPVAQTWRTWTIWLPCVLAFLWSGMLIVIEVLAGLISNLDTTAEPQTGWVYAAVIGHCILAGATIFTLVRGLTSPSQRRAAAIAAWIIIPVGLGWLVLAARLLGRS
jgi:hypothetical protein